MSLTRKISLALIALPLILLAIVVLAWNPNWFKGQATPYLSDIEQHSIDFAY